MPCKYCLSESVKPNGSMKGKRTLKCLSCGKRFTESDNLPKMRVNKQAIVTALSMYFEGLSTRKVSRQLESIYGEKVSQVTIWKWVRKYSEIVSGYTKTLAPHVGVNWHHDETVIRCEGRDQWFWETIDEETRMIVASHFSESRTMKDTVECFKQSLEVTKSRPRKFFVDGSMTYERAFKKAFFNRDPKLDVYLVQRVGIRARQTNNIVERLHETVKERTRPMRGFKNQDSARAILEGYVVNYNFARPHLSLKGKTPAQQAGIEVKGWKALVENAIQKEALEPQSQAQERISVAPLQVV